MATGGFFPSYVWLGRTIVTGNPSLRYAAVKTSSASIFLREYSQYGLIKGVLSVMGQPAMGFWYADALLIKIYCLVFP